MVAQRRVERHDGLNPEQIAALLADHDRAIDGLSRQITDLTGIIEQQGRTIEAMRTWATEIQAWRKEARRPSA